MFRLFRQQLEDFSGTFLETRKTALSAAGCLGSNRDGAHLSMPAGHSESLAYACLIMVNAVVSRNINYNHVCIVASSYSTEHR